MTKTANYQLPQWEASDPVRREDFNDAMEKIDTGIKAAGYVAGTYTGNGLTMDEGGKNITLGFQPKFVIISRGWTSTTSPGPYFLAAGTSRTSNLADYFTITTTGFRVAHVDGTSVMNLNNYGTSYSYVAFR